MKGEVCRPVLTPPFPPSLDSSHVISICLESGLFGTMCNNIADE